jgi:Zn finger protein HypA/HybF involved in hydrogenase expression
MEENVQTIVDHLLEKLDHVHIGRVEAVYLECGKRVAEKALRDTYHRLIEGTPLEEARLYIDAETFHHLCLCGKHYTLSDDDLYERVFVCPYCGELAEFPPSDKVALLEVDVTEPA